MTRDWLKKHLIIPLVFTVFGVILGALIGLVIADYYHDKNSVEERRFLLDSVEIDFRRSRDSLIYPQLFDSAGYLSSGTVWPKLSFPRLDVLYAKLASFMHYESYEEFIVLVAAAKTSVDEFNERIALRNLSILISELDTKVFNPGAYHFYQTSVLPKLDSVSNHMNIHRHKLVD